MEDQEQAEALPEGQVSMFGETFGHRHYEEWQGMPPFELDDQQARLSVLVSFRNLEDRAAFFALVGQSFTTDTRAIWYPKAEIDEVRDLRWRSEFTKPKVAPSTKRERESMKRKVGRQQDGGTLL